jgi:UDP-N-acetylglucosamine--N-acetylmuramyl-(pentapeptide) pyrophosphoryl-undecaprenol N-acetylglucosamine transferase
LRTIRIVNYAINGIGTGHLTRLRALSRSIRRLVKESEVTTEIFFVSSGEADGILFIDRFPSFKLPSRTVLREGTNSFLQMSTIAAKWVATILSDLRPDLIVVDSVPMGSYGEFLPTGEWPALQSCKQRAFIYRPSKASSVSSQDFQNSLKEYDLILVPEQYGVGNISFPEQISNRIKWCGPIISCDHNQLKTREDALLALGNKESSLNVYVSAGGGGHADAEAWLRRVCDSIQACEGIQVSIGAGPLYRGEKFTRPNVKWLETLDVSTCLMAFDIAITTSGYNTFHELMFAGIPTIFLPLEAYADDQSERARRAAHFGAAVIVSGDIQFAVPAIIDRWRDPRERSAISVAAKRLVPANCADVAARELLNLIGVRDSTE